MYNLGQTYQTGALSYGNQFLSNPINEDEKNSGICPIKSCRYAFNGMEQDKEVSGNGNSYTTQFRQYDPRLGRWKSLDPLAAKFPWQSPFAGMDNNPIALTDVLGLETDKKGDEGNGDKVKDVERGDGRRNRARRESHYLKELAKKEGIDDYSITFKKDGGATMHYVEKDNTTVVLPNGSVFIDNGVVNVAPGPGKAKGLLGRILDNIKSIAMDDTGYKPRQIVKVSNSTHSGKFEVQAYSGLDIMGQSVGQVSITQKVDDVTGFWDLSVSSSISYTGGFGVDIEANILERAYITILKPVKARNLADWANSGSQIQTHGWTWIYVNYTRLHGLDPKTKEAIWTGAGYGFGAGLGYSGSSGVNTFKPTGLMDEQDSIWKAAFDYKLYGRREYLKSKGIVTPKSIDSVKSTYYNK
jgi:RHS repeat-associated protein